jgi:hypothetical protein
MQAMQLSVASGASALLCIAGLSMVVQAEKPLPGHSIVTPPLIGTLAMDWFLAGTVIPSTRSLVLSPGVPSRLGMIWSKYPLLTNDFEVELEFTVKAPSGDRTITDDGFAFWYVNENATEAVSTISDSHLHNQDEIIANSWSTAYTSEKFDLLGYRNNFDGVGVFFANGGQKKDRATIGGLSNDGKSTYKIDMGIPATDAMQYDYRSGNKVVVKMRFRPLGVKIEVQGGPSQEIKCDVKSGGYMGFSIYGGNKGKVEASERSDFVELWKFNIVNHDDAAKGEDLPRQETPKPTSKPQDEKEDLLHESSSRKDHRAESEAIKSLTNMVFKLIVESQPMRAQMTRAIESLDKRVSVMEKTFENLKVELDKRTGHKLGEEFDAIKKELTSLSKVASTETQERHKKLEVLHADIAHVHKSATSQDNIDHHLNKLTQSNQRTIENLNQEHSKMFGVSIAAIAFIIIAGLSLYNKFRCWEKKHVL